MRFLSPFEDTKHETQNTIIIPDIQSGGNGLFGFHIEAETYKQKSNSELHCVDFRVDCSPLDVVRFVNHCDEPIKLVLCVYHKTYVISIKNIPLHRMEGNDDGYADEEALGVALKCASLCFSSPESLCLLFHVDRA